MRLITVSLLTCSFWFTQLATAFEQNSQELTASKQINASKIEVKDPTLATKIAISFHHAILDYQPQLGYIIADLSTAEIQDLKNRHIKVSNAPEWQLKYQQFQNNLLQQRKSAANSQLAGIPGFSCYPTVEETLQQGAQIASDNPQIAEWIDIGDSWKKANGQSGFDLMVLKLTNKSIAGDKPKLFIHSSMHAREYAPAALNLDFAKQLIADYLTDADTQWIIDHHEIHLLFQMNPDGRKIAEGGIYQRKNTNQDHCPGSSVGVDLNRNFKFSWNTAAGGSSGEDCEETFRGISAESEPETIAVSNYIRSIFPDKRGPNLQDAAPSDTSGLHLDLHSFSQLVLWPFGHTNSVSGNNAAFVELGNKFAWFNNYAPTQSIGLYATDGTSDDVSYGELGVAAFTFELGNSFFESCTNYNRDIKPDNLPALLYAAKVSAAPYLLGSGPEISRIEMNSATSVISVSQGSPVTLKISADAHRTKLSKTGRSISKIEYSVNTPIWQSDAEIVNLAQNDGDLSSGEETLSGELSTQDLPIGRHTLFFRAYDAKGNLGVTSAAYLKIAQNNSPVPKIVAQCDELTCSFDASTSIDIDGSVEGYAWDFNDNNTGSGAQIEHTFKSAGQKEIELTVTDDAAASASTSILVNLTAAPPVEPPTPTTPTPGSSGGGALGCLYLGLLVLMRRRK